MRIKINDKIYRLKEIESGVDSLMELVEEPKFEDGDFLHSDWDGENITIICRKINGNHLYYHVSKSNSTGLGFEENKFWPNDGDFRLATESKKKELINALAEVGKRWNEGKKCIEDIPKRKFKKGDKVRIKKGISSKTHQHISPGFIVQMDDLIGKELTVDRYANGMVYTEESYYLHEEWLESYEELKAGDLAIFWDENKEYAKIGIYLHRGVYHYDHSNTSWTHAIKFESKEQYEKLIKGEL